MRLVKEIRRANIVDLQDHLDQLRGQRQLLLLRVESFDNILDLHVVCALLHRVDAQPRILLGQLSRFQVGHRLNRRQTRVLRERNRDRVLNEQVAISSVKSIATLNYQGISKRSVRVLFQRADSVGFGGHGQRTRDFSSTAAVHNSIVLDQISHHAQCVVQRPLRFVDDHLIAAANQYGHCPSVGAILDDQHAVLGGAEHDLFHSAGGAC